MTSRERMLAAMRRQPVDRVPIPGLLWGTYDKTPRPDSNELFTFNDLEDEIAWKKKVGFDLSCMGLGFGVPGLQNPAIRERVWQEHDPRESVPILCQEWKSPKGVLSAKLRLTEDYPFQDIRMFDDFNTARYTKPLFSNGDDMLAFVAMDPWHTVTSGPAYQEWLGRCRDLKAIADREGAIVLAYGGCALDYLIWSATADQAILLAIDYPDETLAFLSYLNRIHDERLELTLGAVGADYVLRRGWYDSADFWGPEQFRQFAAPYIRNTVRIAHQAAVPCVYQMCTGIMPLLPELAKLDFDCLLGVEPVATGQDLRQMVKVLGDKKSFWTGLSAPLQIGRMSPIQVRQAVRDAFEVFGRKGFLLSAVPTIRRHWPWENVEAMLDEYRKME